MNDYKMVTIEFLKCRADLNFEVDFGVNGAIGTIVTKWDLIYLFIFIHIHILWYTSTYSLRSSDNNNENNNIYIYIYSSNDNK